MPITRLNLGSGLQPEPGYCNVDLQAWPGVDQVHDLDASPWPWPDASISRIRAFDVWEHVSNPITFMQESHRVLKPGGVLDIHTCGVVVDERTGQVKAISPNYFRDPTHKRASDPQSFDYWIAGTYLNQRYGTAYTGGFAVFEHVREPQWVDGLELAVLLRKPLAAKP